MEKFANKLTIARNSKRNKIIKLPRDLNSFLLTQSLTMWQRRIIYSILNVIKDYQITDNRTMENEQQLELFKMYWNDDNSTATFNFHFSDFVPKNIENYKREQIEQALKGLVTIGLAEQEEVVKGKNKKRFTGIIFNPIWENCFHTCSFQMTASWFKIFVIALQYHSLLLEDAMMLSARGNKFLSLLLHFEFKGGFFQTRKDLCAHFRINITKKSILERDYLFPIKVELNNKGELSFNWSYHKEKDRFDFVIYRLKNVEADKIIPTTVVHVIRPDFGLIIEPKRNIIEERKIATNAAIKYIIKSRKLNKVQTETLFNLCMKYGYEEIKGIIKNTTKNNVENSFKNLRGHDFIEKILSKFPL